VADFSSHLTRYDADGGRIWTMTLPSNARELVVDSSGNRFLTLFDGAIARINGETLSAVTITNPPQSQTAFVGDNITLSVGVSGFTPLRYYWFFDNSLLSFLPSPSLTLPNVTTNQAGAYYVIVSNMVNSVTSAPIQLRIKQVALYIGDQLLTNEDYTFMTNPLVAVRSVFTNGSVFYTLDGSTPTFLSAPYTGPFGLFSNVTVRAIGYSADFSHSEEADAINAIVLARHTLVAASPGKGSVTLNPPGGDYLSSTSVAVTAVPEAGWSFLFWTGDASGSSNPLNVAMHSDKRIQAVFGTTLSTTVQGDGQVSVYPSSGPYYFGQIVRLTAVPGLGSYFGVWGNAADGSTNPLYFTVTNAIPVVSSLFVTNGSGQVTLTAKVNGHGSVTVSPQANVYSTGQSLTLTASAAPGQSFVNWTGDATGSQNPLSIVLNQNEVVTANFTGIPILRVDPKLGEGLRPEGFRFSVLGDSNSIYEVRCSSNMLSWDSLGFVTNTLDEAPFLDTDANVLNFQNRFYELKR
jgi:hypothetical protein